MVYNPPSPLIASWEVNKLFKGRIIAVQSRLYSDFLGQLFDGIIQGYGEKVVIPSDFVLSYACE